jgi:hypothetical protein
MVKTLCRAFEFVNSSDVDFFEFNKSILVSSSLRR